MPSLQPRTSRAFLDVDVEVTVDLDLDRPVIVQVHGYAKRQKAPPLTSAGAWTRAILCLARPMTSDLFTVHPVNATHDTVRFEVSVVPRSSRSRIVGVHAGRLKVALAAPPVDGEANRELCETLAKALSVPIRAVRISHGEHSKHKTVQVTGVRVEHVLSLATTAAP